MTALTLFPDLSATYPIWPMSVFPVETVLLPPRILVLQKSPPPRRRSRKSATLRAETLCSVSGWRTSCCWAWARMRMLLNRTSCPSRKIPFDVGDKRSPHPHPHSLTRSVVLWRFCSVMASVGVAAVNFCPQLQGAVNCCPVPKTTPSRCVSCFT